MNHTEPDELVDAPYPSELDGLIKSTLYKAERWRVQAGGGVQRSACRAKIARPRKHAVSNQCGHHATKWFGKFGFCALHANQILKIYKIGVTLSETADDPSYYVQY